MIVSVGNKAPTDYCFSKPISGGLRPNTADSLV